MAIVLERRTPTAAFTETSEEFPIETTGASVFAGDVSDFRPQPISEAEMNRLRLFIALLSRDIERLQHDVKKKVQEIPRFQQFGKKLQQFLKSSYRQRAEQRGDIVEAIRSSAVPSIYIHEILGQCSTGGAPDRLDIGIDLVAELGGTVLEVFDSFSQRDQVRWQQADLSNHVNDDVCYILLRSIARANVPNAEKRERIAKCLRHGTNSIREAATHALGDWGGEVAKALLKEAVTGDPDALVRESAQEALDDLDS